MVCWVTVAWKNNDLTRVNTSMADLKIPYKVNNISSIVYIDCVAYRVTGFLKIKAKSRADTDWQTSRYPVK